MTVWHVVVEAWNADGHTDVDTYDLVVLSHSERGARASATRTMSRELSTPAHSIEATQLDHRETGVIFGAKRHGHVTKPFTKEFPW